MWNLFCLRYLFSATLVLVLIKLNVATLEPTFNDEEIINSMVYVGSIEGKSFFADNSAAMNWTDAKQLCVDAGMALASIKSIAQADLLFSAQNNVTFNKWYSVAGRDSQTPSQFAWDADGETLQIPGTEFNAYLIQTCLFYSSKFGTRGRISGDRCAYLAYVLCEITHGH